MKAHLKLCTVRGGGIKQRGVVLFIALIALVAMSLAAVALVRSVDTSTIIAGNLAFKQSATSSADSGLERAIAWLTTTTTANVAKNMAIDATHALNVTSATVGYYSNAATSLDLTADTTWTDANSSDAVTDATGNSTRYVIQRMCRNANQVVSASNCLFGGEGKGGENIAGEPSLSLSSPVMYRVTARVTGPRNTVSYIQAFAY